MIPARIFRFFKLQLEDCTYFDIYEMISCRLLRSVYCIWLLLLKTK